MATPTTRTRTWTVEEVLRMVETGILSEDEPLELIEGELITLAPQGPQHSATKDALRRLIDMAYGQAAFVRDQSPLDCGVRSLPEPDISVVRGTWREYTSRHPRGDEAILVVEIARSSQAIDHAKAAVYAAAKVPEYWILDLAARRLEVHREPRAAGYAVVTLLAEDVETNLPGVDERLKVADLLP